MKDKNQKSTLKSDLKEHYKNKDWKIPKGFREKKAEIEPLSDEALQDVSGGLAPDSSDGCCSCSSCSGSAV